MGGSLLGTESRFVLIVGPRPATSAVGCARMGLGMFMVILDAPVVATSLPTHAQPLRRPGDRISEKTGVNRQATYD